MSIYYARGKMLEEMLKMIDGICLMATIECRIQVMEHMRRLKSIGVRRGTNFKWHRCL
jgi:CxxC motif-containing protein